MFRKTGAAAWLPVFIRRVRHTDSVHPPDPNAFLFRREECPAKGA